MQSWVVKELRYEGHLWKSSKKETVERKPLHGSHPCHGEEAGIIQ